MAGETTEAWFEAEITAHRAPDSALLLEVVDPLIHEQLGDAIESWHYFWEPALRLRLRWRDPGRAGELGARLASLLDARRDEGRFEGWAETSHGLPGTYAGESDAYGREAWDLVQKDWMNGSELALRLLRLQREGRLSGALTPTLAHHWSRHVHLFTNQLLGPSWDEEILRCLEQARGYLAHSLALADSASRRTMLDHVTAALSAASPDAPDG